MTPLPPRWKYPLFFARVLIFSAFLSGGILFLYVTLFPAQEFFFNFANSKAQSNTIESPRSITEEDLSNGHVPHNGTLLGNVAAFGDYSKIDIRIIGETASNPLVNGTVSVRRSQRAFLYPDGSPAPFPKGSLLRLGNAFYQIAPNGTAKRFPSESVVRSIGYDPSSFLPIESSDLAFQRDGGIVVGTRDDLPDGTFIKVDGTYYEWRNEKLIPFVSPGAFLFRFPDTWAIPEDASFVQNKTISDEWRGFPSGAVLAWGDGAYIMDGSSPRAVLGVDIFLSLGYSWDDLITVSDEELSLEQKGKSVNFNTPHPDGSVLADTKENRYFLIDGGKKREILSPTIRKLWLGNRHPISVSLDSLATSESCTLSERYSLSSSYLDCSIPLDRLRSFPGDTYELSFHFPEEASLQRIDASFETKVTQNTLLARLSKLKNRVLSRYISTTP